MELSTSTNLCAFTRGRERMPVSFCIDTLADAGYRVLDMNFCVAMNPDSPMRTENWQDYVEEIRRHAERRGIVFRQSHLPYYDVDRCRGTEKAEEMEELIRRSILGSARLGVRWAVTHPFTVYSCADDPARCLQENREYYAPHVALAKENGLGIALETDFDLPEQKIYCSTIGELTELCDAFGDVQAVGICYDFGHAQLQADKRSHREKLREIGTRLKAVHVQDNHGQEDEHLLPFFGSIDWENAMAGLADIGYAGDLTFEIQEFGRSLPADLKHLSAELSIAVGQRLREYYIQAGGK